MLRFGQSLTFVDLLCVKRGLSPEKERGVGKEKREEGKRREEKGRDQRFC